MSTFIEILEPAADGTLHVPLPASWRHQKIRIEAKLEPATLEGNEADEAQRLQELMEITKQIQARNPFKAIAAPVAWQQEMREDCLLPGRE